MFRRRLLWLVFPGAVLRGAAVSVLPVLLLGGLSLLAVFLGHYLPSPPVYLESNGCPQPCWQGLQVGVVGLEEALDIIKQNNLASSVSFEDAVPEAGRTAVLEWRTNRSPVYNVRMRFRNDRLTRLDLIPEEPVLLADVFGAFGPPSHAVLCQAGGRQAGSQFLAATLYFFDGAVEVWSFASTRIQDGGWQVNPEMAVSRLTYRADVVQLAGMGPMGAQPWRGFGRVSRLGYCR